MVNLPVSFSGVVCVVALSPHAGYVRGDVIDYFPFAQGFSPDVYNNPDWGVYYIDGGTLLEEEGLTEPAYEPDMITEVRRRAYRLDLDGGILDLAADIWTVENVRLAVYTYPDTTPGQTGPIVVA